MRDARMTAWQTQAAAWLLAVMLLPVVLVAAVTVKLLELGPPERYRLAAVTTLAAGILLLLALSFNLAGIFYVSIWVPVKAFGFHPWPWMVKYFNPWRVMGSSLAWGLAAGGLFALLRSRGYGYGYSGMVGAVPKRENAWQEKLKEKRAIKALAEASDPEDGFVLGVDCNTGKPVEVSDAEMNMHMLVTGGPGSGKTTTIKNPTSSAIRRGIATVILDGKGDPDFAAWIKRKAEAAGRVCKVFSLTEDSCHYDPLAEGGITELKDKLLYLEDWSEKHWEAMAGRYLQIMLQIFQKSNIHPDLLTVFEYFHPKKLEALVRKMAADEETKDRLFEVLDGYKKNEKIEGLGARLATLTESEIAHLFRREGDVIDLTKAILNREVIVFSLDSLAYPEFSRLLGKLITVDLKGALARAWRQRRQWVYAVFDEFNIFASDKIIDAIGKGRGFGLCAIIATQSLADIEAATSKAVINQILDNCQLYAIHRANSPESAQTLADLAGTIPAIEVTRQVQHVGPWTVGTGLGTVKEVDEYLFHPNTIKWLGIGEAVFVNKLRGTAQKVRIRKPL